MPGPQSLSWKTKASINFVCLSMVMELSGEPEEVGAGANETTREMDPIKYREVQAVFLVFYTVIFVLGIFGNALICYVVCRNRTMQTVTNLFITNLALSDILLCVLCVPFTPLYTFLESWIFGKALCYIVAPAMSISVYISTVTLTSIAIDRFFVIIYPFRPRMKLTTCFAIILGSWLFSLLATLPYGCYVVYTMLNSSNETNVPVYYCEEEWPRYKGYDFRKIYGCITVTMQFIVPFSVIAFCYTKVSLKLNDQARAKPGTKNSRREEIDRERKRRTNRMLIAMVSIFALSWLPLNGINIINDFSNQVGNWKYYNLLFFLFHALAMSSTCYNPLLYAWLNENFRKEFKEVLPGFTRSKRRSSADCAGGWKSERTCNGNETETTLFPSTAMMRRCSSIRIQLSEATENPNQKGDTENLLAPKAIYNLEKDNVELHLNADDAVLLHSNPEENMSSPPTDTIMRLDSENAVIGTAHGQLV